MTALVLAGEGGGERHQHLPHHRRHAHEQPGDAEHLPRRRDRHHHQAERGRTEQNGEQAAAVYEITERH